VREAAWARLRGMGVDVALLQETVPPRDFPAGSVIWREIGGWRRFGSAVATFGLPLEEILSASSRYSGRSFPLLNTFPGSVVVARVRPPDVEPITVVSVYGVIDVYSQTTLLRVVADLVPLFDSLDGRRVVLGGDLNMTTATKDEELPRYRAIFAAIESLGLENLFVAAKQRPARLAGCECDLGDACFHVRTHRNASVVGTPREAVGSHLDYLFASPDLARCCTRVRLEDDASVWESSDHCPVVAEFEIPPAPTFPEWDEGDAEDIGAAIEHLVAMRPDRPAWKPTGEIRVGMDRARSRWIAAFQDGELSDGSAATIEVGVWREPAKTGAPVVSYAGFFKGPEWARRLGVEASGRTRQVAGQANTYFVTSTGTLADLERDLETVLDALLDAAAGARAARDGP